MKPILSRQVQRKDKGPELKEWEPADSQLTDAGRSAFADRQRKRLEQAQRDAIEQGAKVRTIKQARG